MADTIDYFNNTLPEKMKTDASFASLSDIFQFEIEGAGTWHITTDGVVSGEHKEPDCVIAADKATFDEILAEPSIAMVKFMEGKLTASDLGLAMQLQQFFG